ncbi:hypothetical protein [Alicyclobacillus kakegawensis]|uniref:hypothetical protein n=1 Tax=Alicyclobacillus kakegawensis TaxID=392012 RepID=UPI000829EA7A|nr:hypothetical protein [Alicyclobacillus kakegawensis]
MVQRSKLRLGFVGLGRKTFDTALASQYLDDSIHFLSEHCPRLTAVSNLVTDMEEVHEAVENLRGKIDVLIVQFTTFVDGRFIEALARQIRVPTIVWAIREPNRGVRRRLALNSLTGANLASHVLVQEHVAFQFLYGDPGEAVTVNRLTALLRYFEAYRKMRSFTVVTLGDAPDGFQFSLPHRRAQQQLGIHMESLDLQETFARAESVPDDAVISVLDDVRRRVRGLDRQPRDAVLKFAKMQHVLRQDLARLGADAVAVRCWPEFFTEFGAAACSTVSALIEDGIVASCEADVLGALSMDVVSCLTGSPAYLGDLVELDESTGAMTFWHCGAGAFSLARPTEGATAGEHPNRAIGFTLEFGLKPGRVTIFRLGEDVDGGVRALVSSGTVLDEPQRFLGTSGRVVLDGPEPPLQRLTRVLEAGWEPHYALAYGDVADWLVKLCGQFGIEAMMF